MKMLRYSAVLLCCSLGFVASNNLSAMLQVGSGQEDVSSAPSTMQEVLSPTARADLQRIFEIFVNYYMRDDSPLTIEEVKRIIETADPNNSLGPLVLQFVTPNDFNEYFMHLALILYCREGRHVYSPEEFFGSYSSGSPTSLPKQHFSPSSVQYRQEKPHQKNRKGHGRPTYEI